MVIVGDNIEMSLVVDGREIWRAEGIKVRVVVCPHCGDLARVEGEEYPPGHKSECWNCDTLVEDIYKDAWECADCEHTVTDRDAFLQHVEECHAPSVLP
jgi:hypothetical protein